MVSFEIKGQIHQHLARLWLLFSLSLTVHGEEWRRQRGRVMHFCSFGMTECVFMVGRGRMRICGLGREAWSLQGRGDQKTVHEIMHALNAVVWGGMEMKLVWGT